MSGPIPDDRDLKQSEQPMRAQQGLATAARPLLEENERFGQLAELLPEIVYEMDATGRLTFANHQAFDMFGYTRQDFEAGLNALDMLVPVERETARQEIQAVLKGGRDRGTETVLLVEDEEAVRHLARAILHSHGYRVLEANGPGEALLVSQQHDGPIHLLLSDVVMPKMSGCELAGRLAALRPDLRVLFISGYTGDALLRHGVLPISAAFLQKPFSVEDLARKVRETLDAAQP